MHYFILLMFYKELQDEWKENQKKSDIIYGIFPCNSLDKT